MSLADCKLITLPKIDDPRGNLTFIESGGHIPFEIKRAFYIYDVPAGQTRGAHAHKQLQQFLICLSGSFDVMLDDGKDKSVVHLNRPWLGLYIPPMIWDSEGNFDAGSVCLVLASIHYDESDYYREYQGFLAAVRNRNA